MQGAYALVRGGSSTANSLPQPTYCMYVVLFPFLPSSLPSFLLRHCCLSPNLPPSVPLYPWRRCSHKDRYLYDLCCFRPINKLGRSLHENPSVSLRLGVFKRGLAYCPSRQFTGRALSCDFALFTHTHTHTHTPCIFTSSAQQSARNHL